MSTAVTEPVTTGDLIAAIQKASPGVRVAALSELVRLHQEHLKSKEAPLFVWNADGLATAMLVPFAEPFDPNAHTKEPGYEESIRKSMEEALRHDELVRLD
jgi:hypothetical protein